MTHTKLYKPIQRIQSLQPKISDQSNSVSFFYWTSIIRLSINILILNICLVSWSNLPFLESFSTPQWIYLLFINLSWFIAASWNRIYTGTVNRIYYYSFSKEINIFLRFFTIAIIGTSFVFPNILSISFLILTLAIFGVVGIGCNFICHRFIAHKLPILRYAIIGGDYATIHTIKHSLSNVTHQQTQLIPIFHQQTKESSFHRINLNRLIAFIKQRPVDKLFYVESNISLKELCEIKRLCDSFFIDFEIIPKHLDTYKNKYEVHRLGKLPIITSQCDPLQHSINRLLKRTFDIIFSLFVLTFICSWLFPIIAFFIKKESSGPIFFSQNRTGLWNKTFRMYKFRSMVVNTEQHTQQTIVGDQRITKVGAFLRKTNLDELPQFFNVLLGEMSVVGPRPHMLKHTKDFLEELDHYLIRHRVKPGITGWAQVNGYRGPTPTPHTMIQRVKYDYQYITNWTFLLDIRCVLLTVINMIKGEKNAL